MHALDAKVALDDNARFRHPEWDELTGLEKLDPREREAAEKGLQYVGLEGDVGVIANGAGLAMATCDIVNEVGGKPANFLDIGGGANAEVMANALEVINNDPSVKSIFINIFGGITKGEEVANGIVQALGQRRDHVTHRHPSRRDERGAGPRDPEGARIRSPDQPTDDGGRRAQGRGAGRRNPVSILVNADTKVIVQGLTGGQGRFYGLRNRDVRHQGRRRGLTEEGRHRRRRHPRVRVGRRCRERDGCDRDDDHRARAGRRCRGHRSRGSGPRARRRRDRGHPDARRGPLLQHRCA